MCVSLGRTRFETVIKQIIRRQALSNRVSYWKNTHHSKLRRPSRAPHPAFGFFDTLKTITHRTTLARIHSVTIRAKTIHRRDWLQQTRVAASKQNTLFGGSNWLKLLKTLAEPEATPLHGTVRASVSDWEPSDLLRRAVTATNKLPNAEAWRHRKGKGMKIEEDHQRQQKPNMCRRSSFIATATAAAATSYVRSSVCWIAGGRGDLITLRFIYACWRARWLTKGGEQIVILI